MNETTKKEIKKMEEAGLTVVATQNGQLSHVTGGINTDSNVCDSCSNLIFTPDPDPDDWFRDGDQKAECMLMHATIEDGLERPSEMINIAKPLWCPKLGRKLTDEEQKIANRFLAYDRKR